MATHAMAMVKWEVFRSGEREGDRYKSSYYYACKQKRLVDLVGQGGTLWLVTSRRKAGQPRRYHLAYKLVDCMTEEPWTEKAEEFGRYMVVSHDRRRSVHFSYNDATAILRRLIFTSGKPMAEVDNIGLRLLTIPQLTAEDVILLNAFEQKLFSERCVFLSYSHRDLRIAERLEAEMERRGIHVRRDSSSLERGEEWRPALAREVRAADYFLVLVSPQSAISEWVRREVGWALAERGEGGLVERIIPVVLPGGGWESFSELHAYQRVDYPRRAGANFFDDLARELSSLPQRRR